MLSLNIIISVTPPKEELEITPVHVINGKTYGNYEKSKGALAMDKDLRTNAAAVVAAEGETWIKVEFDREYFVHSVILYCRLRNVQFYRSFYESAPDRQ